MSSDVESKMSSRLCIKLDLPFHIFPLRDSVFELDAYWVGILADGNFLDLG